MTLIQKKPKNVLNKELQKSLLDLIYFELFTECACRSTDEYTGEILLENGLKIKFFYRYKSKATSLSTVTVRLFYDCIYPVLFFKCDIKEYEEVSSFLKNFSYYKQGFARLNSLEKLFTIQNFLNQFRIEMVEVYSTSYHPNPWMTRALKEALEDKMNSFDNKSYQRVEAKQQEIDRPLNRTLKIEDKEQLRRELKELFDVFSNQLIDMMMQAYEEDSLKDKSEHLRKNCLDKIEQMFQSSLEERKENRQKKLK